MRGKKNNEERRGKEEKEGGKRPILRKEKGYGTQREGSTAREDIQKGGGGGVGLHGETTQQYNS